MDAMTDHALPPTGAPTPLGKWCRCDRNRCEGDGLYRCVAKAVKGEVPCHWSPAGAPEGGEPTLASLYGSVPDLIPNPVTSEAWVRRFRDGYDAGYEAARRAALQRIEEEEQGLDAGDGPLCLVRGCDAPATKQVSCPFHYEGRPVSIRWLARCDRHATTVDRSGNPRAVRAYEGWGR